MINGEKFKKLQRYLKPGLIIPSDTTLKSSIHPMFEQYKEKVKKFLYNTSSTITLCIDGWGSRTMTHYFGIVAHVLYKGIIRVVALSFGKCNETDGISTFNYVKKCAKEFTIGHRIKAICTDNGKFILILASPNNIFVERFQTWSIKHNYPFRYELGWIRCFNHCVNLAVEGKIKLI